MKLLLASFIVLAGYLAGQTGSPDRLYAEAVQMQQKGDLDGAIQNYRALLKMRPELAEARSNLGAALARQGRYQEAISEYSLALSVRPSNSGVRMNLALAYYKAGQIQEATRELTTVVAQAPQNRQATLLLADCYLRTGDNKKVIELLAPEPEGGPDDLAIAYLLGTAYIRDDQVPKGQPLIDRILRNGESAETHLMMGTVKMMASDFSGALKDIARAVDLNPKLPDVYSFYGMALLTTGDSPGAAAAFTKELESNANDYEANLNLGMLLRRDQKYDEAMPYLERALRVRPGSVAVRYQIATLAQGQGRLDEARKELEQIVKDSPGFVEANVTLATVYYRLGRKADGDRYRAIVEKLNAERQAKEPGVKPRQDESK
jgi:Flp pilus assembly protein TadD